MPLNMHIVPTNTVTVPGWVADELADAYETLKSLTVSNMLSTDPFTGEDYTGPAKVNGEEVTEEDKAAYNARKFVRQGKAWAASQTGDNGRSLVFVRKGDIKGDPAVVSFRIYELRGTSE